MANFISWAIGEINDDNAGVESLKIPEVSHSPSSSLEELNVVSNTSNLDEITKLDTSTHKESTNIPIELIKKIDKMEYEQEEIERIKVSSTSETDKYITLKMSSMSMDEYLNSYGTNVVHRLRVNESKSPSEEKDSIRFDLISSLKDYLESEGIIQELNKNAKISELPEVEKNQTNADYVIGKIVDSLVDSDISRLPNKVTFKEYFDNILESVETLKIDGKISDEIYVTLQKSLTDVKNTGVDSLRQGLVEPIDVKNASSNPRVEVLNKLEGIENPTTEELNVSRGSSDLESMEYGGLGKLGAGYATYVKSNSSDLVELSVATTMALYGYDWDSTITRGMVRGVSTAFDRILASSNNSITGTTKIFNKFVDYTTLALQFANAIKEGTLTPENIVWAATFWMFLDPIKNVLKGPKDEVANNAWHAYSRLYNYEGSNIYGKNPFYSSEQFTYDQAKGITGESFKEGFERLPFKGRESLEGLELRDDYQWDAYIEPYEVAGYAPPALRIYNSSNDLGEEEEREWVPIKNFNLNLNDVKTEDIDVFGVLKFKTPSDLSWNLSGSITFQETSRLWFNRWRKSYLEYIYNAGDNSGFGSTYGTILHHPYQQCCYKLIVYLYNSIDFISENPNSRFIKKFTLIILPVFKGESYSGSSTSKPADDPTIDFSIVGGDFTSILKLGDTP